MKIIYKLTKTILEVFGVKYRICISVGVNHKICIFVDVNHCRCIIFDVSHTSRINDTWHLSCYDNFSKKIFAKFLIKIGIKTNVSYMMHFQNEIVHLFIFQKEALISKNCNKNSVLDKYILIIYNTSWFILFTVLIATHGMHISMT